MFDEYETQLLQVFKYFSRKKGPSFFGTQDLTVTVQDLITMFKKTNILDGKKMQLHELLMIIEKYYSAENKLETKLSNDNFNKYLRENPMLLKSHRDAQAKKDAGEDDKNEDQEEVQENEEEAELRRQKEEEEKAEIRAKWQQQIISEHLINVRGVEIIYFEFKEIILETTQMIREHVDPKTGKIKVLVTKFIEDVLLKRMGPYIKFDLGNSSKT